MLACNAGRFHRLAIQSPARRTRPGRRHSGHLARRSLQQHGTRASGCASVLAWVLQLKALVKPSSPFGLSRIFARRSKGVGKKHGCGVVAFLVLLSDKDRLSTGAIEPVL